MLEIDFENNSIAAIRCNPLDLEYVIGQTIELLPQPPQHWSLYGGFDDQPDKFLHPLEAVLEPLERAWLKPQSYVLINFLTALSALSPFEQQYAIDLLSKLYFLSQAKLALVQSDDSPLPTSLSRLIKEYDWPMPSAEEIRDRLIEVGLGVELSNSASGLSHQELRQGLNLAAQSPDPLNSLQDYRKEKLSLYGIDIEPKPQVKEIGGLDRLVAAVDDVIFGFSPTARLKNLPYPRGWLLAGPPGTGKTHCARVISGKLGFPMLSLSVDTIMVGGIKATKRVLAIAKSCSPCVLMLDEIEKMFSNPEGEQLLGYLLTWINDKTDPIFVIGTLNRPGNLRIEITRAGRFDEVWEVPLPDEIPRRDLFNIFLAKYEPRFALDDEVFAPEDWKTLTNATLRFAPAEIERVVDKTMSRLYRQNLDAIVTVEDLVETAESFYSMYRRDESQMLALQNAVAGKAVPAQSEELKLFPNSKYHPFVSIKDLS
jgi:ATP-dependent 26S proteasome regulatory subunit